LQIFQNFVVITQSFNGFYIAIEISEKLY